MAKLQSPTEPPSDAERIAALQVRNAELELELQQVEQRWRKQAEEITENAIALLRTTLEATADGILVINAQGSITHFNRKFAELWKLPQPPTALENDWQLLPLMEVQLKDSQAFLSQVKAEYAQTDLESHGFLEFTDGRLFERYSKPQVLGGEIIGRVITYRDITAWRQAEKALRQSEERFRATFEQAAVGIAHCVKGRFIHANQKCCDILGYTLEELQTLSYINITHPDDLAVELPYAQRLIAGKIPAYSLEKRYIRKDGSTAWINLTTSLVRESSGEIKYATALIEDISDRKCIEEALRQSEERFSKAFRVNPVATAITTLSDGRYIDVNDSFLDMLGFHREEVIGKTAVELGLWVDSANRPQVMRQLIQQLQAQPIRDRELQFRKKTGEIREGVCAIELINLSGELCLLSQLCDVTDRKRTEAALLESQAKLNAILDSAIAVIVQFRVFANRDWKHEFFSSAAQMLYGYTPEELMANKNLWISRVLPEDLEKVILPKYEDIFAERTAQLEYRFRHKDGTWRWFSMTMLSQRDETTQSWVVTSVDTDISERKQAEEQLAASLQEKEVLLKEVHHRVKNNLQVVSSLLDLQSQDIQEPQVLEMFRQSQNRVRSMALIHEKLYQSESLSKVNLADYIESLVMYLIQAYAVNPDRIALQLNLEPLALNLDTAIPCGLILNELISNALKYAFPGNMGGTLWISLHSSCSAVSSQESNVFELVVGNDGVKLPELLDLSSAKTLGFQLVNILIQQLQGQIEVSQNQGIEFKIRFWEL